MFLIINRKTLLCAVSKDAEESFKKTVEVDYLIDMLRDADEKEVSLWRFAVFVGANTSNLN